jgi:AraC-like DNA-binding protein
MLRSSPGTPMRESQSAALTDTAETWHRGGIEFTSARYRRQRYCPHFHEQYSIGLIVDGALRFSRGRRDYIARAGDITLINPGETHTGEAGHPNGWITRNLLVPVELIRQFARQIEFAHPVATSAVLFAELIVAHGDSRAPDRELESECATFDALVALSKPHSRRDETRAAPSRSIVRACEFVRDSFRQKITLDAMAAAACLSKFHFVRAFAQQVGISPHAFVVQVRLHAAVTALKSGAPAGDVATSAGFADQAHFCRAFKRTLGVTPAAYARAAVSQPTRKI